MRDPMFPQPASRSSKKRGGNDSRCRLNMSSSWRAKMASFASTCVASCNSAHSRTRKHEPCVKQHDLITVVRLIRETDDEIMRLQGMKLSSARASHII